MSSKVKYYKTLPDGKKTNHLVKINENQISEENIIKKITIAQKEGVSRNAFTDMLSEADSPLKQSDVIDIHLQTGGLFNSILRIVTVHGVFFYKHYLDNVENETYNLPDIAASKRARLAYKVQKLAESVNRLKNIEIIPEIIHFDKNNNAFLMKEAACTTPMIDLLEAGTLKLNTVSLLAHCIASFHKLSYGNNKFSDDFENDRFRDFKLYLQYDQIAEKLSHEEAVLVKQCRTDYQQKRICVVHGDINSKNILANKQKLSIIDFEQAHVGSPAYDVAYILSEIVISCLHHYPNQLQDFLQNFFKHYYQEMPDLDKKNFELEVKQHLAIQIIYRFWGPSAKFWTFYLSNDSKKNIIKFSRKMLVSKLGFFEFLREEKRIVA